MQRSTKKIQYILARLTTNHKLLSDIQRKPDLLNFLFETSSYEHNLIKEHLDLHGHLISKTAELFEEKRWMDLLLTIKHTTNIVSQNKLKLMWRDYLDCYDVSQHIPSSSVNESIEFLRFIIKHSSLSKLQQGIAEYELKRNITLTFNFDNQESFILDDFESLKEYQFYKAQINPSFIMFQSLDKEVYDHVFSYILKKDKFPDGLIICFYKNQHTFKVHRIILSKKSHEDIVELVSEATLKNYSYNNQVDNNAKNNLLINLYNANVIFIDRVKYDD